MVDLEGGSEAEDAERAGQSSFVAINERVDVGEALCPTL
jgi:hypothetical protein